jgi:hypothetical protein
VEQLKLDKLKLYEIIIEINDKVFTVLDHILCKIPGYDRLKIFSQYIKAKVRRIDRKILISDEIKINDLVTHQKSERIFECPDDACSNSSKQSLENNIFVNNIYSNDEIQSFEYVINPIEDKIHSSNSQQFNKLYNNESNEMKTLLAPRYSSMNSANSTIIQCQNNTNFQINKPMLEKCENLSNRNSQGSKLHEVDSQIREIPTSTITSVSNIQNVKNIDKYQSTDYSIKNNVETSINDDVITNVNLENFSSFMWNDSEGYIDIFINFI